LNITKVRNFLKLIRVWQWRDKVTTTVIASLILSIDLQNPRQYLLFILLLIIYQSFVLSYGFLVNSVADFESDSRIGKDTKLSNFSKTQIYFFMLILATGILGIPFTFKNNIQIKMLSLFIFFLATFYSLKPIRFKERGIVGILVSSLTQRAFIFLFFVLLISADILLSIILLLWLSLIGILTEMAHQLLDLENDIKTGVKTWASNLGMERAKKRSLMIFSGFLLSILASILIFPITIGLPIAVILLIFSDRSIFYYLDVLKAIKQNSVQTKGSTRDVF
jgi:4-hydroxybenzoate polyprenyltransferase